jgi:hypothetical protein
MDPCQQQMGRFLCPAGVVVNSARLINVGDVAVHSRTLVVAPIHDGGAEGVTDFGIDAGQCVVQANAQGNVIGDREALRRAK